MEVRDQDHECVEQHLKETEMKPKHKSRKADVKADLARLKGQSNAQLARDDKRGATSPLGTGMGKKKGAGR